MQNEGIVHPYERFAEVYDDIGSDEFGLDMLKQLDVLLDKYDCHVQSALDLACGTGTVALALARRGIAVTGVDISPAMLARAKQKAALEPELAINFIEADMRKFSLPLQVELATCFFDAMNYNLRDCDLQDTFHGVFRSLKPGGLFVFDMNSVHALQHVWGNNVFTEDNGHVVYIWQNEYEPATRTGTLTATFFVQRGRLYEKFVEIHVERAFFMAEVRAHLEAVGLQVLAVLRPNGKRADETASRHLYVTRKPL